MTVRIGVGVWVLATYAAPLQRTETLTNSVAGGIGGIEDVPQRPSLRSHSRQWERGPQPETKDC